MAPKTKALAKTADAAPETVTLSKKDLDALLGKAVSAGRAMGAAPAGPWQDPMLSTRKYRPIYNEAGEIVCDVPFMDADGRFTGGGGPILINGQHPDDYFAVEESKDGKAVATENHK